MKRAQVWIETVLYTLIGLALIGVALGFIMPKINESKDKLMVEQAINTLSVMDGKINEVVEGGAGNIREVEFSMKRGEFYINSTGDNIVFVIPGLSKLQSEEGREVKVGRIAMTSIQGQKTSTTYLKIAYSINITYKEKSGAAVDKDIKFTAASVPYKFLIENEGYGIISITERSGR
ncbi:MAG: hypothetical protein QXD13_00365 [Candidatus Pacearchaeota archaeon]